MPSLTLSQTLISSPKQFLNKESMSVRHPLQQMLDDDEEFFGWDIDLPASLFNVEPVPSGIPGIIVLSTQVSKEGDEIVVCEQS
jgi:hypothetical protein